MKAKDIPLDQIRTDGGTQPRESLDLFLAEEYAGAMQSGSEFPPAECVFDGSEHWLWDGFHRYHAARKAGRSTLRANVRPGTAADARWLALSANKTHGLRRSNEDKRRAVEAALKMRPEMSDRAIAEHCGVDNKTVAAARERLTEEIPQSAPRTGRDGRTVNTANIGKRKAPLTEAGPEPEPASGPEPDADVPAEDAEDAPDGPAAVEPPPQRPGPRRAAGPAADGPKAPAFPHSRRVRVWLEHVAGQTLIIEDMGGIGALLAEPDKWDWREVRDFILPMLDALGKTIGRFHGEIEGNANH